MSAEFILGPEAEQDLRQIWRYVANASGYESVADRLAVQLYRAMEDVAKIPTLGHRRPDLLEAENVRFFPARRTYMIIYVADADPIYVLRILHGSRNITSELSSEE